MCVTVSHVLLSEYCALLCPMSLCPNIVRYYVPCPFVRICMFNIVPLSKYIKYNRRPEAAAASEFFLILLHLYPANLGIREVRKQLKSFILFFVTFFLIFVTFFPAKSGRIEKIAALFFKIFCYIFSLQNQEVEARKQLEYFFFQILLHFFPAEFRYQR